MTSLGACRGRWLAVVATSAAAIAVAVAVAGSPCAAPSPAQGEPVPPLETPAVVRLAAAGDTGTGDAQERATARAMDAQEQGRAFDGLVLLGDLVYDDGDPARVPAVVTDPFAAVLDGSTTLVPVLGNHDVVSGQQSTILRSLGRASPWYVQSFGPVRVIVLDSTQVEDPDQTAWLRATLTGPQPADGWTVVALHHPPFSAGQHGSDGAVRDAWSPLFAAAGVSLVLGGHDHDYQRSTPQDGVTYVVSGAGAKLRPTGAEEFTAVSTSIRHFLDLAFYPSRIDVRAVDQDGRLVDSFGIQR